jgi:hypothetical protein
MVDGHSHEPMGFASEMIEMLPFWTAPYGGRLSVRFYLWDLSTPYHRSLDRWWILKQP